MGTKQYISSAAALRKRTGSLLFSGRATLIAAIILYIIGLAMALPILLGRLLLDTNNIEYFDATESVDRTITLYGIELPPSWNLIYGITFIGVLLLALATLLLLKHINSRKSPVDYDAYNHLRNTGLYCFLRDWLFLPRMAAIRTVQALKNVGVVALLLIALVCAYFVIDFLYDEAQVQVENERQRRQQREQQEQQHYRQQQWEQQYQQPYQNKPRRQRPRKNRQNTAYYYNF